MNITQFLDQYELHDSLLEFVSYNAEKEELELKINFCYWMQSNYDNLSPETGLVLVKFYDVIEYSGLTGNTDDFSILELKLDQDGSIIISVLDDDKNEFFSLSFKAKYVEICKL